MYAFNRFFFKLIDRMSIWSQVIKMAVVLPLWRAHPFLVVPHPKQATSSTMCPDGPDLERGSGVVLEWDSHNTTAQQPASAKQYSHKLSRDQSQYTDSLDSKYLIIYV